MNNTTSCLNTAWLHAENPQQKRALSYSQTLYQLFTTIMQSGQPADRVLADYFREHKKHGSKDRRVIRETLFSLFRWWGWLQKIPHPHQQQNQTQDPDASLWQLQLCLAGALDQHSWHDLLLAWLDFAKIDTEADPETGSQGASALKNALTLAKTQAAPQWQSCNERLQWLNAVLPQIINPLKLSLTDLVPAWFLDAAVLSKHNSEAVIEALSSRPPIWGRAQNISPDEAVSQLQQAGIAASPCPIFNDSLNLGHKNINLNGLSLYKQGQLEIQDLASQMIGQICAPKADENWWDACAGAGGKSLQLRSLMLQQDKHASGKIIASDLRQKALAELSKRAKRAKFRGISTQPWKTAALPVKENDFDGVLVDAPCSCIGTWRRNPDLRWLSSDTLQQKQALQLDILSRSSQAVKAGGKLVYATCSLSAIENEQVVNAFLAAHPEFSLDPVIHPITGKQEKMLTIWPFEANSDGMFVAKMIKGQKRQK